MSNTLNLKELPNYRIKQDSYVRELNYDNKSIKLEIGDTKQVGVFHPQFKLGFFDNRLNYSVRYDSRGQSGSVSINNNRVLYSLESETVELFETSRGYEIGVRLSSKPLLNVFRFTLQVKNVNFYYQTPISEYTPERLNQLPSEDIYMPEEIEGSYAIYSKIRKPSDVDSHSFRSGKVGHIYRPYAEDANQNRVWCDLNYNNRSHIMTVTVPQSFLDTATYPVFIDPDFGYTTLAGTQISVSSTVKNNCIKDSTFHHAASSGEQIDSITAATGSNGAGVGDYEFGAYDMGTGNTPDGATLNCTGSISVTAGSSKAWRTTAAINSSITSGNNYAIAVGLTDKSAGNIYLYYDTTDGGASPENIMSRSADTNNLDATWSEEGQNSYIYSMYGTVSATSTYNSNRNLLMGVG